MRQRDQKCLRAGVSRQLNLFFSLLALLASHGHARHALHIIIIIVAISVIVLVKAAAAAIQIGAAKVSVQDALVVASIDGRSRIRHQVVAQMGESALHGGHQRLCRAWPERSLSRGRVELCLGEAKSQLRAVGRGAVNSGSVRRPSCVAVLVAPGRAQPFSCLLGWMRKG
ncbi:hypothetical protein IWX46DRAFT_243966 [Phyllosticta citricarpa]|uniref:Secreted protein n=1 Tax=Phyllosticta citricarpa TaxID=55181 RepID=A0ABR1LSX3_9PEZI